MSDEEVQALVARASELSSRSLAPIRLMRGGQHALTVLVHDGSSELVVRGFPPGDAAVAREVQVLRRLDALGALVPRLVCHAPENPQGSVIVTTRLPGEAPANDLDPVVMAEQMAVVLAKIHQQDGHGLPSALPPPDAGSATVVVLARGRWSGLAHEQRVLTHHDFWCGNALWVGDVLTGVVDWSGARHAPRGVDVAWFRQDLVLLGFSSVADVFLSAYERASGVAIPDIQSWDIYAAAQAVSGVEDWAVNYAGIGRLGLDGTVLRRRLELWIDVVLRKS